MSKEEAISQIVALVKTYHINLDELSAALSRQQIDANKKDAFTLTTLFSILGGIFILSGLSLYTSLVWGTLNAGARILITLGPGIICLILAVALLLQNRREKTTSVLIVLSAVFQTIGLFVGAHEFLFTNGNNENITNLIIFVLLALQYGLLFFKLRRTSLLFFTIYFSFAAFSWACHWVHISDQINTFIFGLSLLALHYGIHRTPYNRICGFGYFIGSVALLWLGFDLLKHTLFEILYLGIACFMLYVSTVVQSRTILITSTLAVLTYLSYFTSQHFANSLGWPVCLIILGFFFFVISSLVLKLNKRLSISRDVTTH